MLKIKLQINKRPLIILILSENNKIIPFLQNMLNRDHYKFDAHLDFEINENPAWKCQLYYHR